MHSYDELLGDCGSAHDLRALEGEHRVVALKTSQVMNQDIPSSTHVERCEPRTIAVECRVVEVGELVCDSVDVSHGEDERMRRWWAGASWVLRLDQRHAEINRV